MSRRVVIVGASAAGVAVAETLQRLAPDCEIVMVGDESDIAHDRPPLSKQLLQGVWQPGQAELLPPSRRQEMTAKLIFGRRATGLDAAGRELRLDDGATLTFDDLVIATGVHPRMLPGSHPKGVHVLRDLKDCESLRAAMLAAPQSRLAVVGGGFIGLEVAASARKMGYAVTVIEPDPGRLAARIGQTTSDRLLGLHRAQGVDFKLHVGVSGFTPDSNGNVRAVQLSDGSSIESSVVLVAIGCVPSVQWLSGSTLDISDGVICDEYCRAAPGIWAAGDVAMWRHVGLDRHIRVEHRLNATDQGMAVAGNIVGPLTPYTSTPFFWTDQYNIRLQLAGVITDGADETIEQLGAESFLHTFRVGGRLVAVMGWNAAKAMMPFRRELTLAGQAAAAQHKSTL